MNDLLRTVAGGCAIRLRVVPGSSRARLVGRHGDAIKVAVTAPPELGKANKEVESVVAEALGLGRRDVAITAGLTSRDKTLLIRRASDDVRERLIAALS